VDTVFRPESRKNKNIERLTALYFARLDQMTSVMVDAISMTAAMPTNKA
jgi:hypothetical protein